MTEDQKIAKADYMRAWRLANKERIQATKQSPEARERARLHAREYRARNPEKVVDLNRRMYAKNAELRKQAALDRYRRHRKARSEYRKAYYYANHSMSLQKKRDYCATHPEYVLRHSRNRRARIRGSQGRISKDLAKNLLTLQKFQFLNCRRSLKAGYHMDHIFPLSRGGDNVDSNIQLLCPTCNLRKKDKDPLDWARQNGRLL